MSTNHETTRLNTTVLLLLDPDRPESVQAATRIERALESMGVALVRGDTNSDEPVVGAGDCDAAIVIDGDGTMTQQPRLADHNIPMIGVNCGRLGFLAPFSPESLIEHAKAVLGEERTMEERILLSVEIHRS